MQLNGKKALLTGATGGIGEQMAQALARAGVQVIISGRNRHKLTKLLGKLQGRGHKLLVADITRSDDRRQLVALAQSENIDLLINAAGNNRLALLPQISDRELNHIMSINLLAPMALCKDLAPHLCRQKDSAIVNVGSILGSIGYAGSTTYCASKFGLRGFTEALRREFAGRIDTFYFAPRATDTDLNSEQIKAMNKELGIAVDTPQQVAKQLLIMLKNSRPHNRYLGWPEAFFVRLNSLFPKLIDKALLKQLPIIRRYAQQPE